MADSEPKQSPTPQRQPNPVENGLNMDSLISPRFKSLAAMAGWDEESILVASLIVEDTPDRQIKQKRLSDLNLKTPPSNGSRRKRRNQGKSPISIAVPVINLHEEAEIEKHENRKEKTESKSEVEQECKRGEDKSSREDSGVSSSKPGIPCMDKLKEELSCAICLEICYEPSTTSCGHSFCKKCLRSAADKCGKKCPKCRQLISNGRSCTVNTVLWNTIQLLFPQDVEARKAAGASNNKEESTRKQGFPSEEGTTTRRSWRSTRVARIEDFGNEESPTPPLRRIAQRPQRGEEIWRLRSGRGAASRQEAEAERNMQRENLSRVLERGRRRGIPNQDEDAALALRLQREEFMGAFRGSNNNNNNNSSSVSLARANLRAMASRATNSNSRTRSRAAAFFLD